MRRTLCFLIIPSSGEILEIPTNVSQCEQRVWGVMHREVNDNKITASFAQFTEAIDDFFTQRLPGEWKVWRSTITDNFPIISQQEFRVLE
jgi:hypothetical protein